MTKTTESAIEKFAIELLEKQGYQYIYAPSIASDSETPERQRFEDVLLTERLQSAVGRINVAQFISLYRQEGTPREQPLKNKGEYTEH